MKLLQSIMLIALMAQSLSAFAGGNEAVADMQSAWAKANYADSKDAKQAALEALLPRVDGYLGQYGNDPAVLIWSGIIKSTYAGVKSGLGALKYAKAARADLESAMAIDANALNGSAYTSLGTLYFKVPGWPIAFGDSKKAERLLKTALEINPNGIDPNFFYGEYLMDNKRYEEARRYLQTARQAPRRPDRPLADAGRQREIDAALAVVESKLN